jgi:hypothetical protein
MCSVTLWKKDSIIKKPVLNMSLINHVILIYSDEIFLRYGNQGEAFAAHIQHGLWKGHFTLRR